MGFKVRDILVNDKCSISSIITSFPFEVKNLFEDLNPTNVSFVEDTWVWRFNLNGKYTTRSYYSWLLYLKENVSEVHEDSWN